MNENDLIWLAGWLEGEGCFSATGNHGHARISGTATDEDVMREVCRIFDVQVYGPYETKHKPKWQFAVYGQSAIHWMMKLYPYMRGARRKAAILEALQHELKHGR